MCMTTMPGTTPPHHRSYILQQCPTPGNKGCWSNSSTTMTGAWDASASRAPGMYLFSLLIRSSRRAHTAPYNKEQQGQRMGGSRRPRYVIFFTFYYSTNHYLQVLQIATTMYGHHQEQVERGARDASASWALLGMFFITLFLYLSFFTGRLRVTTMKTYGHHYFHYYQH